MAKKKDESTTPRSKVAPAKMKAEDDIRWRLYLDMLGLDAEESETAERLTRPLVLHLLLDRAVTSLISLRFLDPGSHSAFLKIEATMARLDISKRIELAKASQLISASCATDMNTVNTVRNKLAHYEGKRGWGMDHVQELCSAKAFERCIHVGMRAVREIVPLVAQKMKENRTPKS